VDDVTARCPFCLGILSLTEYALTHRAMCERYSKRCSLDVDVLIAEFYAGKFEPAEDE
jgi:hypothetical protein